MAAPTRHFASASRFSPSLSGQNFLAGTLLTFLTRIPKDPAHEELKMQLRGLITERPSKREAHLDRHGMLEWRLSA